MGKKLEELSIEELAVATIGTELRVGKESPEAKLFRAESARRQASDAGVAKYVDRAWKFAALIANGETMDLFHRSEFTRADRSLAVSLGAKPRFPRMRSTGVFALKNKKTGATS
jgi:hypothetical protein